MAKLTSNQKGMLESLGSPMAGHKKGASIITRGFLLKFLEGFLQRVLPGYYRIL